MESIDKARKMLGLWAEDVQRLKRLSALTGRTQVELVHTAIIELEQHLTAEKEKTDAR